MDNMIDLSLPHAITGNGHGPISRSDVVCFSHLRWNFVYQRPQHLMSRFARSRRVFFIEEPIQIEGETRMDVSMNTNNVIVCVPLLSPSDFETPDHVMPELVRRLADDQVIEDHIQWFYTPMMLGWSQHLRPAVIVYDCMDELSAFRGSPPEMVERERELLSRADLVFTGGRSLYEAKKERHKAVYAFPSSIDVEHFAQANEIEEGVAEQKEISRPRVGFAGVIDERLDTSLLGEVAELRPDISFVIVGPVVKISEDTLPRRENIHYLGKKAYEDLPALMAGWDVGMMPFALNESTRFISPTKTPEYLAAGLPVVSTPIADVVRPYGELGLVHIAGTAEEFAEAISEALNEDRNRRQARVGEFLLQTSWDKTFEAMNELVNEAAAQDRNGPSRDEGYAAVWRAGVAAD
ncbi:MAG: glycosyl transferase [Acidobacteria bacterium]|nr:MAG: glycosyl transferase [Acidobacteriota bacterium]